MKISFFKYSDKGSRTENQDALAVTNTDELSVACIADGVGGINCGKIAATESVSFFVENVNKNYDLAKLVGKIHYKVKELQELKQECSGMATTFTGCVIENNLLKIVHVGDSRICILRGDGIKQLSESHTELNRLLKIGKIQIEDADNYPRKHILESAIGMKGSLTIQTTEFSLKPSDRILLTTDGVHNVISKIEFRNLSKKSLHIDDFGDNIINLLKTKSISDNISFVAIEVI
jgi:PPM family protein phosphatase